MLWAEAYDVVSVDSSNFKAVTSGGSELSLSVGSAMVVSSNGASDSSSSALASESSCEEMDMRLVRSRSVFRC